jgi:pyruvate,water dikinase
MGRRVEELGALARREPAALAWLAACERAAGIDTLPDGDFARKLHEFIGLYGHRCAGEGELRHARWSEDLLPVLHAVLAAGAQAPAAGGAAGTPEAALQALLASVDSRQQKEAQQLVQQIRRWLPLQSRALNAYAYVLAGTRFWALAAGREAMSDKRLLAEDDVFFYELEEVKEMMTGEWNVSDRAGIQATAAERKARWQASQTVVPGELLIGDQEATMAAAISAAPGKGQGTVVLQPGTGGDGGKVVLAGTQLDSGWAISLPTAAGVAVAQGAAIDPAVAAAAAWPLPVVYALGAALQDFAEGTPMVVDGDTGQVAHG